LAQALRAIMGQQLARSPSSSEGVTGSLPLAEKKVSPGQWSAVARAEALVLERAPRRPWPAASIEALHADGVILISTVLSATTAAALRAHFESRLAASIASVASGAASESDVFEPIACPEARHYISCTLEPQVVVDALAEALQVLAPFIRGAFKCDEPLLTAVGGIRTTGGAPPQPIHTDEDMRCSDPPGRLVAMVALQDTDEPMGPTIFLPGTHASLQAQIALSSPTKKAQLLRAGPIRLGVMPAGSCSLHNTGLLHAGGGNRSSHSRWMFSFSFVPSDFVFSVDNGHYNSMCRLGVQTLGELERGAVRSLDHDETKRLRSMWSSLIEDEEVKGWKAQYERNLTYSRMNGYDMELWRHHIYHRFQSVVGLI